MKLQHRRTHRIIWVILPVIVAALFVAALAVRSPATENRAIAGYGSLRNGNNR